MVVHYDEFNKTNNHAYNVYNALRYCREHNRSKLVFDKGVYDFYPEIAAEDVLCVSNHDIYGIKRIAFLIKEMKNFCIDGGGSEFVFHGSMIPFAVKQSENIILKNFSVDIDDVMALDIAVTAVDKEYFDVKVVNNGHYYIKGGRLHFYNAYGDEDVFHYMGIRSVGDDKSFLAQSRDVNYASTPDIFFEDLGERRFRVHNSSLNVEQGMHLFTRGRLRFACDIVLTDSKNLSVEAVSLYKSYGMGLLAQKCENVTVDRMIVKAKADSLFSLNCDGTHFVHCKGLVKVSNSSFSEQQDDALNIHGIYTKIVDKTEDFILVKYMQKSAKGINIYEKGSVFAVLNHKTLIPSGTYLIEDVEVINLNYTRIYVKGGTGNIKIGDVVEDLTWSCDLLFENNRVTNNRARGILIAAKGKVEIKNNYFNTPGVAILFQSDGQYWFESGGTTDVEIRNNIFDNCRYTCGNWGRSVIEIKPREEFNEGEFYHKKISIMENSFINNHSQILYADNIEEAIFKNNNFDSSDLDKMVEFVNCGEIRRT